MSKNTNGTYDYDNNFEISSEEEQEQLGKYDYSDLSEEEVETSTEDEENYSTLFKDKMPNALYVKECATKTKEEKRLVYCEICETIHDPNSTEEQIEDAKYKAICYMYALIRKLVKKYCSNFVNENNYNDFVQIGIIAVLSHLDDYKPEDCVPSTYFYDHIKHELIKSIGGERGLTRYYNEKLTIINRAINKFKQANKPFTEVEIAAETGEPVLTVSRVLNSINAHSTTSLSEIEYMVTEKEESPEEICIKQQKAELVRKAIYHILAFNKKGELLENDFTYAVILHRYGFITGEYMSQSEIAKRLQIPVDTVRACLALASKKLKNEKIPARILFNRETTAEEELKYSQTLSQLFPEYNFNEQIRQKENIAKKTSFVSEKASARALEELAMLSEEDF